MVRAMSVDSLDDGLEIWRGQCPDRRIVTRRQNGVLVIDGGGSKCPKFRADDERDDPNYGVKPTPVERAIAMGDEYSLRRRWVPQTQETDGASNGRLPFSPRKLHKVKGQTFTTAAVYHYEFSTTVPVEVQSCYE